MTNTFLDELISTIHSQKNTADLHAFISAILTPKELQEIPKRLQIVKMLKQGIPQRIIAEKLEVGIATVTRGSKEIQRGNFKNI